MADLTQFRQVPRSVGRCSMLTEREEQLVMALATHEPIPEIAASLNVTTSTVRSHCRSIYAKLGVSSRGQLIALLEGDASRVDEAMAILGHRFVLTLAQRRLASYLARGVSLRSAQRLCRVATSTIRTHLRALFVKTHTRNQAELVHLIWTVAEAGRGVEPRFELSPRHATPANTKPMDAVQGRGVPETRPAS